MTRRQYTLVLIHVFLAIQIALPIAYYAVRADKNDERFAWRMFSTTRMVSCGTGNLRKWPPRFQHKPRFMVGEQRRPAQLQRLFHTAWINLTARGRETVIEAMALELCKSNPGEPVYVQYDCAHLDGRVTTESSGGFDICRTGKL